MKLSFKTYIPIVNIFRPVSGNSIKKSLLLSIGTLSVLLLFASPTYGQSANWSAVLPAKFPTNASGQIHGISRVSQLKFHSVNPNKIYAVSARGGLFITTDGGNNWQVTPGTDFMSSARLASVCVDFTNDSIIYLGTGDHNYYYSGIGVLKSVNGGQTFTQTTLTGKLVVEMIMDPDDHNVIVAATNTGIYKTTNAGATWTLKSASRQFDDLKQKTPPSRVLYAAGRDSSFFRSIDFGDNWTQITNGIVLPAGFTNGNGVRIAVTPADTNLVYLGMVVNGGTIYKSLDGGNSFTPVKTSVPPYLTYYTNSSTSSTQGDYNFSIGTDRVNANILYLVAHNVWKSTDGGVTWLQLTNWWQKVHTDMHQIITSPFNNNNLYNMNDGGVWLSVDGGNNWTPKSDGIYGYEIYHGNCSPTRKDMFSIGTQDNGELYATSLGWYCNRGGDWTSQCAFDYRINSSMVYYYGSNKRRLVNGSESTYGLPAQVTLLHDIAFHRTNPDLAFAADSFIYRTTNLTATTPSWTQIYSTGKKIMSMHCAFGNANRLYIITNDGFIHISNNALSGTPAFTSYALPNTTNNKASITSISSNPDIVYATMNTKAYRSIDGGVTWTNITYNLPGVNHVKILADEYSATNELVFVASANTVYYKTLNAATWTIYNLNLPSRTDAIDLSIYNDSTSNTVLRYASYGRGMWETPITNLRALNANFSANKTNPCVGEPVAFSDNSTGTVTSRSWIFTGATPSTSTATNPVVVYNSNGVFDVTLTVTDGISNNSITKTSYISTKGNNLPLNEGFEGALDPPSGWLNVDNGTAGNKWNKTATAGGFGNSINSMVFDNYSWNIPGEKDELQTMRLDLGSYSSALLTFDVAYQVFSGYSDSLAVLISTDCGVSFTKAYIKGGADLSTAGSSGTSFVPTSNQWRKDSISLNSYTGQSIIVAFQNINGYGNKLYIDNINLNATVTANAGQDHYICQGSSVSLGSAAVQGLNYAWSPATGLISTTSSNPLATPSATTTYTLTVTHALSGISSTDTVTVSVDVITINLTTVLPCSTGNPGSATANVTTGVAPFTYLWSTGNTTASISNLAAGAYTITVTDANGCTKQAFTYLQQLSPPTLAPNVQHTSCGLNNGIVSVSAIGGISNPTYSWNTGATTSVISSLSAGTYTVTVTSGACTATATAIVNPSTAVQVLLTPVHTNCGENNGSISSSVSGGINYQYLWSTGETTSSIQNLAGGTYSVTVTSGSCTTTASTVINPSSVVNGVVVSSITATSATVSWNSAPDAVYYNLRYGISSSGTWTVINNIPLTTFNLTSLVSSTGYDVQIQSDCGNATSAWSGIVTFTTGIAGCPDVYETNNTNGTAKLITVATDITAAINPAGDADWFKFNTTNTKPNLKVTLTNLPANYNVKLFKGTTVLATSANSGLNNELIIYNTAAKATYKIKVYGAGSSIYNALQCYTLRAEISSTPFKSGNQVSASYGDESISVYPNPANNEITIESNSSALLKTIQIIDVTGRVLSEHKQEASLIFKINTSTLMNGTYLLRITTSTGIATAKLDVFH